MGHNMEMSKKISIVLPVYNGEKNIKKCIESIKNQNYPYYELIVIDDGSTDNTRLIINQYKKVLGDKIKIIYKRNGGVSTSRNVGLRIMTGSYLMFLDADDEILDNSLWYLNEIINYHSEADVIIYGWQEKHLYTAPAIRRVTKKVHFVEKNSCIREILTKEYSCGGGYPWNKIWKVDSLKKSGDIPEFKEDLILCEDKEWTVRALLKTNKILLSEKILYSYSISDEEHLAKIDFNIVTPTNNKKIISFLKSSIEIAHVLQENYYEDRELVIISQTLRDRDIIMVCYKLIKNNNMMLLDEVTKIYNQYIKARYISCGLKHQMMRGIFVLLRVIKHC